jgi:MFS-type transporter involved in bile tolerance (Atg22 family)
VLSPLLVAVATTLSGAPRSGVFGVSIALLALGAALLLRVRRC